MVVKYLFFGRHLAYVLIGWGEIFAVSAAYEMAFTASPPDKKALASATNIFCVGGLPNLLCILLYHSCSRWFMNDRGDTNIQHIEDYTTAHVGNYFLVLLSVMLFGVVLNTLPGVRDFVASIEEKAADIVKTPVLRRGPQKKGYSADEESPLLGRGPVLLKAGSMRAGPSLSQSSKAKKIKYKYIPTLYQTKLKVAVGPDSAEISTPRSSLPEARTNTIPSNYSSGPTGNHHRKQSPSRSVPESLTSFVK
jgi:POT family proton-dependent oligopeptide transporter